MATHYIFSDTHHGSHRVVEHLKKEAAGKKISVSSTGDFFVYAANDSAPKEVDHPWVEAYKKGDKEGMKKHEANWVKKVEKQTKESTKEFQELGHILKGGRINGILGNSDYAIGDKVKKYSGVNMKEMLGGAGSTLKTITNIDVKREDNTTFVYVPHSPELISKYHGKSYKEIKDLLSRNVSYKKLADKVNKYHTDNVVVLMHESPKPEKWYDAAKAKQRLPDALRAHYDTIVGTLAKSKGKKQHKRNITVFHGHLHEPTADYNYNTNTANYGKVKVQLLNIDDVVRYNTVKGTYEVDKATGSHGFKSKLEKKANQAKPTQSAKQYGEGSQQKQYTSSSPKYKKAA